MVTSMKARRGLATTPKLVHERREFEPSRWSQSLSRSVQCPLESILNMAKKKTAGTNPTAAPAAAPATPPKAAAARRAPAKRSTADERVAPVHAAANDASASSDSASRDAQQSGSAPTVSPNGGSDAALSYQRIAEAAYHRYLSRGGADGGDFDDWIEAERSLRENS
jgi:hypothetical protein